MRGEQDRLLKHVSRIDAQLCSVAEFGRANHASIQRLTARRQKKT
jgi:hypothetical protein